MKTNSGT